MGRMVTSPLRRMLPTCFIDFLVYFSSISRLFLGFHETQRHAIRLADGIVLGTIERRIDGLAALGRLAHRRQRPHAERMVLGVFRVGVDLGFAVELEAGLRRGVDYGLLGQVAVEHGGLLAGRSAMLLDRS